MGLRVERTLGGYLWGFAGNSVILTIFRCIFLKDV
jgi:hypothetical protein